MALPTSDFAHLFPVAPTYSARWAPLYLEPMPGSGERLTVALLAIDDAGNVAVEPVIANKTLRCMYGDAADRFSGIVSLLIDSVTSYALTGKPLEKWQAPLRDAASLGTLRDALGNNLQDILRIGAQLTASLSGAILEVEQPLVAADETWINDAEGWVRQIRDRTVAQRYEFADRFLQSVSIRHGAPPTRIGYLGDRLAAQFGLLMPGKSFTIRRNRAKAYLTDLQILREQNDLLIKRNSYELMLWVPPASSPAYSSQALQDAEGAFAELAEFGKRHELVVEAVTDSDSAARRILQAEEG